VKRLIDLLSLSLHWSDVLPELLESLEQEQSQMREVYDAQALRYRQEPYRLAVLCAEAAGKYARSQRSPLRQ
jgi:phosphoenolpyruvate carboxylase